MNEQRYQFRKTCRTFVKWYEYISQIARIFDKDLHNEYIFCSYLAKIVPPDPTTPFDLGNKVKLEYYSLEKTFAESIRMVKEKTDGQQIFEKNIFPQLLDDAAQEAYMESSETYAKLFEDAGKHRAIMAALAHAMFHELRSANS